MYHGYEGVCRCAAYGKTGNRCLVAVVGQRYAVNVMDEHVLRGNAAIIKCHIPSFVAEFVEVDSWIEDETTEIYPSTDYGTKIKQKYKKKKREETMKLFFFSSSFIIYARETSFLFLSLSFSLFLSNENVGKFVPFSGVYRKKDGERKRERNGR